MDGAPILHAQFVDERLRQRLAYVLWGIRDGHFTKGSMNINDGRIGLRPALLQLTPSTGSVLRWPPSMILSDSGVDALETSVTATAP